MNPQDMQRQIEAMSRFQPNLILPSMQQPIEAYYPVQQPFQQHHQQPYQQHHQQHQQQPWINLAPQLQLQMQIQSHLQALLHLQIHPSHQPEIMPVYSTQATAQPQQYTQHQQQCNIAQPPEQSSTRFFLPSMSTFLAEHRAQQKNGTEDKHPIVSEEPTPKPFGPRPLPKFEDLIPYVTNNIRQDQIDSANLLRFDPTGKALGNRKKTTPYNSFVVYMLAHRDEIHQADPFLTNKDIVKQLAKEWGQVPVIVKLQYKKLARELTKYRARHGPRAAE